MKKLGLAVAAAAIVAFLAGPAYAVHRVDHGVSASKVAVAVGDLVDIGVASTTVAGPTTTVGPTTVLQTFIKTGSKKDLAMDVALQCGIITDTTVKSKGGDKGTSAARGRISIIVTATDIDTGAVRIAAPSAPSAREGTEFADGFCDSGTCTAGQVGVSCSTNAQCNSFDLASGVTYCSRVQQLDAKFAGLDCDVPGAVPGTCTAGVCTAGKVGESCTGDADCDIAEGEVFCENPEELRLLVKALNANAFNFLLTELDPAVYRIEVKAKGEANILLATEGGGLQLGSAEARAFVGLGSMLVESIRLIKGAELDTGPIVTLP